MNDVFIDTYIILLSEISYPDFLLIQMVVFHHASRAASQRLKIFFFLSCDDAQVFLRIMSRCFIIK